MKKLLLIIITIFCMYPLSVYADEASNVSEGDSGIEEYVGNITFCWFVANELEGGEITVILKDNNATSSDNQYISIMDREFKKKHLSIPSVEPGSYEIYAVLYDGLPDLQGYEISYPTDSFDVKMGENIDIPIRIMKKQGEYSAKEALINVNVLGSKSDDYKIDIMLKSDELNAVYSDNKETQKAYACKTLFNDNDNTINLYEGLWQITAISAWENSTNKPLDIYYPKDAFRINSISNELTLYVFEPFMDKTHDELLDIRNLTVKDARNMVLKTDDIGYRLENMSMPGAEESYEKLLFKIHQNYDMENERFDGSIDVSELIRQNEEIIAKPQINDSKPASRYLFLFIPLFLGIVYFFVEKNKNK